MLRPTKPFSTRSAPGLPDVTHPRIFIATPTANGIVMSDHAASLANMLIRLHAEGIGAAYRTIDGPDRATERDMLAADFLRSDCSHLLMLDGNVAFGADLCERLLRFAKPVIGGAVTRGALSPARLRALLETRPFDQAVMLARDWSVRLDGGSITVTGGIGRVAALGPEFLLIERAALQALADRLETDRYLSPDGRAELAALFRDTRYGGAVVSHDQRFCEQWRQAGGEVWLYPAADLRRIGEARFGVPFSRFLAALKRQPDASGAPAPLASDPAG
ncbi:hypothetical protein [Enterovirga sp. CN4-39]|uniref:hypothetical protein n=1 Tax=Enterovirga sp. CN4-39 TaxID=3400910 RepID=UPI003C0CF6B0